MDTFTGFQAGVNLGGWISQYKESKLWFPDEDGHAYFASFITQADIQRIAGWGFDHIRLPVDYPVLEDDARPFVYSERGFGYIDNCIEWCRAAGLNLVIDLHHAPGYFFGTLDANRLFDEPAMQERFLTIWEAFGRRYKSVETPNIVFELLNEVVLPTTDPWNALAKRVVERIRAVDPERWIMIGSNFYNSVSQLVHTEILAEPRIAYTFHFYEPHPFTHQHAPWMPFLSELTRSIDYPSAGFTQADAEKIPTEFRGYITPFVNKPLGIEILRTCLQPALDWLAEHNLPLYCGEYGVIERAPLASRVNWHHDFCNLLNQAGIGRAVWSYKEMDFPLILADGSVVSEELVRIVSEH